MKIFYNEKSKELKSNSWKLSSTEINFLENQKFLDLERVFKLIELNEKFKFIKNDSNLLDLGSFPGGWSQVTSQIVKKGKIMAVDIKDMKPIKNIKFFKGDILSEQTKIEVTNYFNSQLDVIISDMAADTTGSKSLDSIRTNQLSLDIIKFAKNTLKPKGVLISKVFMGEDFLEVKTLLNRHLKK